MIEVYTDGSCIGNGKDTAFGGYGAYFPGGEASNVAEPLVRANNGNASVTSNRAELRGILAAMSSVEDSEQDLQIFTDSQYWAKYVSKSALNLSKPVPPHLENQDIIASIRTVFERSFHPRGREVKSTYVPAHTGKKDDRSTGNDIADTLSVMGSAKAFVLLGLHAKFRLQTGRYKGSTYADAFAKDPQYFLASPTPNRDKMTRLVFEVLGANQLNGSTQDIHSR
jgi:ribonuclease HI